MAVIGTFIIIFIISSIVNVVESDDCILDHRSRENSYEEQVLKHIRCKYDFIVSDLNSKDITMSVNFISNRYELDEESHIFRLYLWKLQQWNDSIIAWNPDDYGGVKTIITRFYAVPTLKALNALHVDYGQIGRDECKVRSVGTFNCFSQMTFETPCNTQLANWPYDTRTCILDLKEKLNGNKVNIEFGLLGFNNKKATNGFSWSVSGYKEEKNVTRTTPVRMTFTLVRQAPGLGAVFVYPSFILTVLTLTSLVFDVKTNMRLSLICFSLFCHVYFISEISVDIPTIGETVPTILQFYKASLILTLLAVLVTCTLSYLCTKVSTPPVWVQSCNQLVSTSVARLVWPRWDAGHASVSQWTNFANIVNSGFNILYVIVYVSMFIAFVPRPSQ